MTEKRQSKKPSFFRGTKYREPNDEELQEIHQAKCSVDELSQGLGYAIIGRGIKRQQEKNMIISSLERLLKLESDNEQYKIALKKKKSLHYAEHVILQFIKKLLILSTYGIPRKNLLTLWY